MMRKLKNIIIGMAALAGLASCEEATEGKVAGGKGEMQKADYLVTAMSANGDTLLQAVSDKIEESGVYFGIEFVDKRTGLAVGLSRGVRTDFKPIPEIAEAKADAYENSYVVTGYSDRGDTLFNGVTDKKPTGESDNSQAFIHLQDKFTGRYFGGSKGMAIVFRAVADSTRPKGDNADVDYLVSVYKPGTREVAYQIVVDSKPEESSTEVITLKDKQTGETRAISTSMTLEYRSIPEIKR